MSVFFAFISGCANVKPEALAKSERREEIVLAESVKTVAIRGIGVRWEEGAVPGTYTATREDAAGVYYFGPGRSIWSISEVFGKKPRVFVGGIFVPHDRAKHPQFFYIFESNPETADNIDAYVLTRVVSTAASPSATVGGVGPSVGANVAGNVIGGAIVGAIIESGVGTIAKFPPIEDAAVRQKILGGIRTSQEAGVGPTATN